MASMRLSCLIYHVLLLFRSTACWFMSRSLGSKVTANLKMSLSNIENTKHVVIAGAGVIGTSTAYFLSTRHGVSTTLVDPTGRPCPAASGKAGGFLALDWNDYSPLRDLARRSFALHQELADTLGAAKIQYRRLTCAGISVSSSTSQKPSGKKLEGVEWAQEGAVGIRNLGLEQTIAQVHPKMFCETLWETASQREGSKLIKGKVTAPNYNDDGDFIGAQLEDGTVLECDAVLFACGPWTTNVMEGVKYHSVVIPTPTVLNQSVFFDGYGDPEVYPRPDSTAYCTGFPDEAKVVQERPGEEEVRTEAVDRIVTAVRQASGGNALSATPSITQACYLPTTPDGLPLMGTLENQTFVAAGHGCWGILLGPATGECMANLIVTGKSNTVNLAPFAPKRFPNIALNRKEQSKSIR